MAALEILVPLDNLFRAGVEVDSSHITAGTEGGDDSLKVDVIDIEEGDWVETESTGKAKKTGADGSVASQAFAAWVEGGNYSVRGSGKITLLKGDYSATTTGFTNTPAISAGDPLTSENGILAKAAVGDFIHAHADEAPSSTVLKYNTYHAGGKA